MHCTAKTFFVQCLGCRTNLYEAEAIASMLEETGATLLDDIGHMPDILVVVTCSITSMADSKTKKMLRKLRREHPSAVIVACGCYVQGARAEEMQALGVDISVGNRLKHRIPEALEDHLHTGAFIDLREDLASNVAWDALRLDRPRMHTRAFVKVQDGCNRGCSYCIVPRLRGAPVSRAPEEICLEISRIVDAGCGEVVLTGIHLGSYKWRDTTLADLVRRVSALPGLRRLRFGSLEPDAVSDALLHALAESAAFCPHLHLPLQSGDDGVLGAMKRGYRTSGFLATAERVRAALGDDVHLSTDLIVGFPGEDEGAFANSMRLLEQLEFGKIHVFPFSVRQGTKAASLPNQVPRQAAHERASRALETAGRLLESYASRWTNRDQQVLLERASHGMYSGWTRHYLKVFTKDTGNGRAGDEVLVHPKRQAGGILLGEEITPAMIRGERDDSL